MRLRWEELNSMEWHNFASIAVELMSQVADPCEEWALKSQTAALVAEVLSGLPLIVIGILCDSFCIKVVNSISIYR